MFERKEIVLLSVVFGLIFVLSLATRPVQRQLDPADQRLSSYRSTPSGARGAYLLFEELGIPVTRLGRSPLARELPSGAIALLAPARAPIAEETREILRWVRAGGTLLLVTDQSRALLDSLGLARVQASPQPSFSVVEHRWTADLDSLPALRWGLRPDSGYRAGEPVPVARVDDLFALAELQLGQGRVIVWSEGQWWTNERLREGGGPALLLARVAREVTESGDSLYFDEFHQGFAAGGGPIRTSIRFLFSTPLGRGLGHVALVGLLAVVVAGVRFGSAAPPRPRERRSPLEHITALATAYRRAHADDRIERLILAGLARRIGHPAPPQKPEHMRGWLSTLPIPGEGRFALVRAWEHEKSGQERASSLADAVDLILSEGTPS